MHDISGCSKDRDPPHTDIDISPYDWEIIADKYSNRFL